MWLLNKIPPGQSKQFGLWGGKTSIMAATVLRFFQPKYFAFKHGNTLVYSRSSQIICCSRSYATKQTSILSSPIPEFDGRPGIKSHQDMYNFSLEHPEIFWGTLARSRLEWIKDFDTVQDCNFVEGKISWFLNGKINVAGKIGSIFRGTCSLPFHLSAKLLIFTHLVICYYICISIVFRSMPMYDEKRNL